MIITKNKSCQHKKHPNLGAKSQQIEKMLQRMAVLQLVLYIRIKEEGLRRIT